MERFTQPGFDPCANCGERSHCEHITDPDFTILCGQAEMYKRLWAYEDTGLEPQEIEKIRQDVEAGFLKQTARRYGVDVDRLRELVEADRDGRCVVLPCKVGDIVYTNMSIRGDKYKMADRPYPVKVVFVGMGDGKSYFHVEYDNGRCFPFDFDQIGKTVFLTREAAAAALKGGQDA